MGADDGDDDAAGDADGQAAHLEAQRDGEEPRPQGPLQQMPRCAGVPTTLPR